MTKALERVIAGQQEEIDQLRAQLNDCRTYAGKEINAYEDLKDAAFSLMDWPDSGMYRTALRDLLRRQNWCLTCRQNPCECDED